MVLDICIWSYHALFVPSLMKITQRVSDLLSRHKMMMEVQMDIQTNMMITIGPPPTLSDSSLMPLVSVRSLFVI